MTHSRIAKNRINQYNVVGDNMSIVICDDNNAVCKELQAYIQTNFSFDVKYCTNSEELINIVQTSSYNIEAVILDIVLSNNSNGIDIATKIHKQYPQTKIIFITGYDDVYYKQIFSHFQPFGFLSKPVQYNILHFFLKKLESKGQQKDDYLNFTCDYKETKVSYNEIIYIQSKKRVCEITTNKRLYKTYIRLTDLTKNLPSRFIRCHQSFIINTDFIEKVTKDSLMLKNGDIIPISRKFTLEIHKLLK